MACSRSMRFFLRQNVLNAVGPTVLFVRSVSKHLVDSVAVKTNCGKNFNFHPIW